MNEGYTSFSTFYPFYLGEHRHGVCRLLHVLGSTTVLTLLATSILTGRWWLLWLLPLVGYGPAWLGHFFFEKNRPATFKYPFYSFLGDWVMLKDILVRRIPLLGPLTVPTDDRKPRS
ncbi:MAG: DUF962 domain-containing protein [Planctomycetota bacterium]|jgi:hypothetical protein|nr:DUF962 domain-containing protein [Planctomycetota bacterium]